MRIGTVTFTASVLAITASSLMAQSSYELDKVPAPMNGNDSFILDVSHPVVVGRHVLQPGRYTCERLDIAGSDLPVLTIRGDNETKSKVNIAASVFPTYTQFAPAETQASYYHIGNDYYFNRIWIRGLNYGYKFRLPKNVKRQETQ